MQALSPEWIPASSICSMIAPMRTSRPSQTASTSISTAFWRKSSMRIGCSGDTLTASLM